MRIKPLNSVSRISSNSSMRYKSTCMLAEDFNIITLEHLRIQKEKMSII